MIRHPVGNGVCYYVAGAFFELYASYGITHCRKLVAHFVRPHSRPPAEVVNAPSSLEVTVRRSRPTDALLVHLVNYTGGMTRPIEEPVPLTDVSLKLKSPARRVRSLTTGATLSPAPNGLYPIPPVREFEVLVVEP